MSFLRPDLANWRRRVTLDELAPEDREAIEKPFPRPEPFEARVLKLRLVEPGETAPPGDVKEPVPGDPIPPVDPQTVEEAEERIRLAATSHEYEGAVSALDRLRSGHPGPAHAAEPGRKATPRMRSYLVKEVIGRDSSGRIAKTREYEISEPIEDDAPKPPPTPEPPALS